MSEPGETLASVIASIVPASATHAANAQRRVASILGPKSGSPLNPAAEVAVPSPGPHMIEWLAHRLAGAQHTERPTAKQRFVVVVAGDHGCANPCTSGDQHPTVVAAKSIADGAAALARVARMSETSIILVNAGVSAPAHLPHTAISLGYGQSGDLTQGPAMTLSDANRALEAGIALSVSLSEHAVRLLAVGAIGVGADTASTALLNAIVGRTPAPGTGAQLLAEFGGPETGVLAGLMLGAASMRVPVILDSYATGAAALVAATIAPAATGYLVAAHRGSHSMPGILAHLGLTPLLGVGMGDGDGTGAAMVIPLADQVTTLVRDLEPQ